MATAIEKSSQEKEETGEGDMTSTHTSDHLPSLPRAESRIERIASKAPVIQIVIVTLRPQMTSALCLCRFQQPQALRSFPLRYPSNAYDRLTSSFAEGYFLTIFSRTYRHYVPNVLRLRSERIDTTFRTYRHHVPNVSRVRSERIEGTFRTYRGYVPKGVKTSSEPIPRGKVPNAKCVRGRCLPLLYP